MFRGRQCLKRTRFKYTFMSCARITRTLSNMKRRHSSEVSNLKANSQVNRQKTSREERNSPTVVFIMRCYLHSEVSRGQMTHADDGAVVSAPADEVTHESMAEFAVTPSAVFPHEIRSFVPVRSLVRHTDLSLEGGAFGGEPAGGHVTSLFAFSLCSFVSAYLSSLPSLPDARRAAEMRFRLDLAEWARNFDSSHYAHKYHAYSFVLTASLANWQ